MPSHSPVFRGRRRTTVIIIGLAIALALFAAACGSDDESATAAAGSTGEQGPRGEQGRPGEPGPPGPTGGTPPGHELVVNGAALDAHTHIMSPELTEGLAGPGVPASTGDDLVERLDEANVDQAVVLSLAYFDELPNEAAVRAENDYTAAEVAKHPDRLIGFCAINPLRPSDLAEIDRCFDELGMTGMKLHVASNELDLRDPAQAEALNLAFDLLVEKDVPVLMHVGSPLGVGLDSDAFANLVPIIAGHPTVRLTLAHCTNDGEIDDIDTFLLGLDGGLFNAENLYVDTSSCLEFYEDAPLAQKELMVWRLRTWGLERVFYASDYLMLQPQATPAEALETLASYPFTQDEIDTILGNDGSAWLNGAGQ